jgi:HEAT repeat protein/Tfp pilus assembly protein PilF
MPWEAIKYVGSGLTLAAFIIAAIAWLLKSKSEERERLINLANDDERAGLVRDALEFFSVDTAGLTKAQQYQLALEQIRERAQRFKIVAVVVCIIAVLGAAIAAYALARSSGQQKNDKEAAAKEAQALMDDARSQFNAGDYAEAWKTVERATALNPNPEAARDARTDIAMTWVGAWHGTSQAAFDLLRYQLTSCLEQAAARATGVRAADIHAHLGWANFMARMDGLPVEEEFKKALAIDKTNPFAHSMWGYWLITQSHPKEGKLHFESAFKSGREKEFVRELQLDVCMRYIDPENSLELILVLDDMRKKGETRTLDARRRLFSFAYANPEPEFLQRFKTILPIADHLATFQWLTDGFGTQEETTKNFELAELTEASGDNAKALRLYRELLAEDLKTSLLDEVKNGIKRTKGGADREISETMTVIAQAKSGDADTRAKLIRSLARADINVAEALPALVSWVQDPDDEVRAAACETLVQFGRVSISLVIPLLSSREPREVMNAAAILEKIRLEPKLAVPALIKALEFPDADVRGSVVEALAIFGPHAEPAVASLIQTLTNSVQTDLQKQIIYALGEIGPNARDAVPQLIEFVESSKDSYGFLNANAADALGKIGRGAVAAVPALIAALKSEDARLPTRSAEALGNIGADAQAAIPALIEALRSEEKEHQDNYAEPLGKIAEALANNGDITALPALKKAMESLEEANMEPKYITPVREAIDALKEKEARSKSK